jgi:gliding motility-associated lipoprotein GldH
MTRLKYINILGSLCVVLMITSCDNNRLFEENQTIADSNWNQSDKKTFEVNIENATIPTNFYINVRNADDYPYSNLYLFITTTFPSGKKAVDTLECMLANEKGKWLGSGMGDIYDNQIPFKRNVRFPEKGLYKFEFQHGMRVDVLPFIMDVGLRIENVE